MDQIGSNLSKLDQTWLNLIKRVETGSKWRKLVIRWYRKKGLDKHGLDSNLLTWSLQTWSLQTWSWQTWSWQTWSCQTWSWQTWSCQTWSWQTWSWHGLYKHGLNKLFFWHGLDKHGHKGNCSQFGIDFQSCLFSSRVFKRFCPYVWLIYKSSLISRAGYDLLWIWWTILTLKVL